MALHNGAELGTSQWIGDIESLENGECNSVSPYEGSHNFAVGGVCSNEMNVGEAYQTIYLLPYLTEITAGTGWVYFGGYLRNFNGLYIPEIYVVFYDSSNSLISISNSISSTTNSWTYVSTGENIPQDSRYCRLYLKGTRNSGGDNDSYFDNIDLRIFSAVVINV